MDGEQVKIEMNGSTACTHAQTHACTHTHTRMHIHKHTHTHAPMRRHTRTKMHDYACVCVRVCVCAPMVVMNDFIKLLRETVIGSEGERRTEGEQELD